MKKNNEIITNDIDKFPEFENIRNAILEAREKVATTVNFAMVSAYWTIGKQLHEAMSGDGSIYGKQLIKYVSVVRYKEGAEMYSMGMNKFQTLAKDAGAILKIDRMVLVDLDVFDQYLESFRVQ